MAYYKQTAPLIGYYYHSGDHCRVDGLGEISEIKDAIAEKLDS